MITLKTKQYKTVAERLFKRDNLRSITCFKLTLSCSSDGPQGLVTQPHINYLLTEWDCLQYNTRINIRISSFKRLG